MAIFSKNNKINLRCVSDSMHSVDYRSLAKKSIKTQERKCKWIISCKTKISRKCKNQAQDSACLYKNMSHDHLLSLLYITIESLVKNGTAISLKTFFTKQITFLCLLYWLECGINIIWCYFEHISTIAPDIQYLQTANYFEKAKFGIRLATG